MYSIRWRHFIQNVTHTASTHWRAAELHCVHKKVDLFRQAWETSFLLHDTELLSLYSIYSRYFHLPSFFSEMTEDPFGASGPGHTAASDSHGRRDGQQTRQLRKDFTLLFSIINEQRSQQIRTVEDWGLPVRCSGAKRRTLGLNTKCYTPTNLLKCDFI